MISGLRGRLEALGFGTGDAQDEELEGYLLGAARVITAEIGLTKLPVELERQAIDMATGEYLYEKKAAGCLEGFDTGAQIKQLQEGDVSVTYALGSGSNTPEERLDELIEGLRKLPSGLAAAWRKLRW